MGNNKAQKREYYLKNREKILARNKVNYDKKKLDPSFKEYRKATFKKYYYKNQQLVVSKVLKSNKLNRAKINKWCKEYKKLNPNYKITCNLRNRLRAVLKNKIKTSSVLALLGCSINDLKCHLEAQFKDGMSWDNYTTHGWHIDHIRPCSSFNLTDPAQQAECFNYKNLQPLWAKENYIKSNKY